MFIVTRSSGLLTPSGVKCSHVHMELLTEFPSHTFECPNSSDKLTAWPRLAILPKHRLAK